MKKVLFVVYLQGTICAEQVILSLLQFDKNY